MLEILFEIATLQNLKELSESSLLGIDEVKLIDHRPLLRLFYVVNYKQFISLPAVLRCFTKSW